MYNVPNYRTEKSSVATNAGGARAFRAPGHPQGAFAMDSLMDEIAEKLGIDPLEIRQKNDDNQIRQDEYVLGAKEIGWHRRRKISGSDKQIVGMICANLKSLKPVEPYKGKRIKEKGQYVLRKEGKKK